MTDPTSISQLPLFERPRERCLGQGASSLSLRECVAVILGSGPKGKGCLGLARELVSRSGAGLSPEDEETAFFTAMESSALAHLQDLQGLGEAGKARLMAAFELGRRYALFCNRKKRRNRRRNHSQADRLFQRALNRVSPSLRSEPREWLGFVPLHRSDRLGELCLVEKGVRTHVNIDPAEFFARLLALRPRGFFVFHNHPSGDYLPSPEDAELTHVLNQLARQFGIALLGHAVVTAQGESWIH